MQGLRICTSNTFPEDARAAVQSLLLLQEGGRKEVVWFRKRSKDAEMGTGKDLSAKKIDHCLFFFLFCITKIYYLLGVVQALLLYWGMAG